ncbi:molybdate ABC transporter permease subunit [Hirschia litorea]|uniref:Molybdenum transport system permease n=1 Tax=Hirschia litorea TaxID=1199156 RepID=A0ABW2IHS1_9PROT
MIIDLSSLWLTIKLALIVTALLLFLATPFALWLAHTKSRLKPLLEAVIALPLVLPPTVLGFYLLIAFNPNAAFGKTWMKITGDTLAFSFEGLVIASLIYSLPFMVQPIQSSFESLGRKPYETALSLGAKPLDAFLTVIFPLSFRGFLTACVLTFAHTIGEFGVVLMVGGNIPQETKVISIAIYEHVETLEYAQAHILSGILLLMSFLILLSVYAYNKRYRINVG